MADTAWGDFPDQAFVEDSDVLLAQKAGGGGVNIPGSALVRKQPDAAVVLTRTGNNAVTTHLTIADSAWKLVTANGIAGGQGGTVKAKLALLFNEGFENAAIYFHRGGDGQLGEISFRTFDAERLRIGASGAVYAGADNTQPLGDPTRRWSTVYAGTGTIATSDEREKREISDVPAEWLDAWGDVQWGRFKFKEGERWHLGLIAQRVHAAFAARGMNAFEIGLCCYDEWDATPGQRAVKEKRNAKGEIVQVAQPAVAGVPAGNRWGLRYDECFAIEAAWQRRELTRLREAVAGLQQG